MNSSTTTQAQQFAAAYAANMAGQMIKTIKRVRQAATGIMLIAMLVSYTHQGEFLASIHTPLLGAWLIPIALDALTFLCVKVLGTPGMAQPAKAMAIKVLVFPVLASGAINFLGPGELITKAVFVIAVLMIPAAELVASRIKPDFAVMETMERDMTPVKAEAVVDDAEKARRSEIAKRAAATRKRNQDAAKTKRVTRVPRAPKAAKVAKVDDDISALFDLKGIIPTSPAPAGR